MNKTNLQELWPKHKPKVMGAIVGFAVLLLGVGAGAWATPTAQVLAVAPAPGVSCGTLTPGMDNYTFTCTLVGLGPFPSTSPSPTASASPTGDQTPPSTPTGLTVTPRSPTSLLITWAASTDNVGVVGYQFDRGTTNLGTTPTPDWLDTGLTANTTYTYRTRAVDAAGNVSAYATITATTPADPTPTPGNNCQANPEACGFPGPNTTGAGTTTSTLNGNQVFSTPGQVVANTQINGCVEVRANNVTFRNVFINGSSGCFWVVQNFGTGLQVIDSTISGNGGNGTCIGSSGLSLLRVELTGCENGLNVSGTTTVVDSWIHDLTTANGAHTDGAQFNQGASGIIFQHNTIIVPTPGATSAIISWNEGPPQQQGVTIIGNLLSGGTYIIYCPRQGTSNTRIINNRFGIYEFGYSDSCVGTHVSEWSGNVVDATGLPLGAA